MTGAAYIPLIVEKLKQTEPEKIILFGSYAYGEPSEGSVLDILVMTNDDFVPSSFAEKRLIYLRISRAISEIKREFPIDLIVHTRSMHKRFVENNSLFAQELLKRGKVLYEKHAK